MHLIMNNIPNHILKTLNTKGNLIHITKETNKDKIGEILYIKPRNL